MTETVPDPKLVQLANDLNLEAQHADPTLALVAAGRGDTASKRYHEGTATGLRKASRRLEDICGPINAAALSQAPGGEKEGWLLCQRNGRPLEGAGIGRGTSQHRPDCD